MAHFRTQEEMYPLIEQWQSSGQTQKAFCAAQHISISVFTYWLRRYRDQQEVPGEQQAGFVAVRVAAPETTALEVCLPTGVVLRFAQVVPVCYLKALL